MEITNIAQLDLGKKYTFKDYLSWKFKERVELLRGYVSKMSLAPSAIHQIISWNIAAELSIFLKGKECRAFAAPFDVYLETVKGETVIQPDLSIICDLKKIQQKGCVGSPDLVIEILSPGNTKKEVSLKYGIYEEAGVKEYWIVYPAEQVLQVYLLENRKYTALKPLCPGDNYDCHTMKGLKIEIGPIFEGTEGLS